jgi:hypothetical protein
MPSAAWARRPAPLEARPGSVLLVMSSNGHPDPLDSLHTETVHREGTFTWVVRVIDGGAQYQVVLLDITGAAHTYLFDEMTYGIFRIMLAKSAQGIATE